ncbi:MAG: ATP-binding protein [Candidatus Ancaeobacter aquaticus]|nr:ATP-binding protein [Candidatus Ancaeobacter aquaticus]
MIISVASGKGGTGKTTVATNLALSLVGDVQLLDCDVEEPNAHIFLKPDIRERIPSVIAIPEIDDDKCDYCGKCKDFCVYNALAVLPKGKDGKGSVLFFKTLCHGCGGCYIVCPNDAISEVNHEIGVIEKGVSGNVQFIHGKLNIGEILSPVVIRQTKDHIDKSKTVIIDAPPGTSCPVVATLKQTDFCILVTEPTPFGLNDLVLAVDVLKKMSIPFGVVINRSDIGDDKVTQYCEKNDIPILMEIPFDREIAQYYSEGIPFVNKMESYKEEFKGMYERIVNLI